MFMKPGSRVVEFMPRKTWHDDAYKRLSFIAGAEYFRAPLQGYSGNRIVDIAKIEAELDKLNLD